MEHVFVLAQQSSAVATGMYTADCGSGVKNCNKQVHNLDKAITDALKSKNQDVVKAAQAFGKLGDKNGVNVSILSKVVDSHGNVVPALTTEQKGTGGFTVDGNKVQQALK